MRNSVNDTTPWFLFLIIFLWTPPHFWALALYYQEDYKQIKLPMLPVVKGKEATYKQICLYTVILFIMSLIFMVDMLRQINPELELGRIQWFYLITALVLGIIFIKKAYQTKQLKSPKLEKNLFLYSIIYLFSLFSALIIDSLISRI